jgi:hypothetical protein
MVELEVYAMGEPTGTKINVDPAFVAARQAKSKQGRLHGPKPAHLCRLP